MKTISIIGTGNVASHLGKALIHAGNTINEVVSKSFKNAQDLAEKLNAQAVACVAEINVKKVDVVLIAVQDDAILEVAQQIPISDALVVHTSGSAGLEALKQHPRHGLFYGLQTFSKQKRMNLASTPFFVEANTFGAEETLVKLAQEISQNVRTISSEQLKSIHLAAVFACNFTNHLLSKAYNELAASDIDFSVLKPLVEETIEKAFQGDPNQFQTGPAKRGDALIINAQLARLKSTPYAQEIYQLLTASIQAANS